MRNYLINGYKQIRLSRSRGFHHFVGAVLLVISFSAFPASVYGWWFTSNSDHASITPTHRSGLILSPLAQRILPEFILEPLSSVEEETPPSIESPDAAPVASSVVLTTPTPTPQSARSNQQSNSSSHIAQEMLNAVNAERAVHGLPSLKLNSQLSSSAQSYANLMHSEQFFSHESPDGSTFKDRNEAAGYTNWAWMGENIAVGQTSVVEVVDDWMNSEGHRANILEPRARELGVGYVGGTSPYWVQEFGVQF